MTIRQIEKYRKELVKIKKIDDSAERDKALAELANQIGASQYCKDMPTEGKDTDNINAIHQALQTATMVAMCETAAKNYWIAFVATLVALASAIAAWTAVYLNVMTKIKNFYF